MSKAQLFLYDFITKAKIKKYVIALILFGGAAFYWRENNPDWTLATAAMSNIGLSIAFMTTLYSIFTYSTMDRIKAYLMLPCKKSEIFFSFVFAQYFTLLLERMAFVVIVTVLFTKKPAVIIIYLLFSSLCTVVLDTVFMMGANQKKYFYSALALILTAGLYGLLGYSQHVLLNVLALALILLLSTALLGRFEAKHLAINRESGVKNSSLRRINYFLTVLLRERIVLVNTVSIFVFTGVFALISIDTPFLLHMLWGVAAMNTPATTMFSGDKALWRQEKMLPRHSRLMSGVYASFLCVYFAAVNLYVMLLFVLLRQFSIVTVLTALVFTVIETIVPLYLERQFPITVWQKKQEVWRNPRKYILPLIVCVLALAPYLFGRV